MSRKSVLDRWKSTPEYSADRLFREKAVMECLESLEWRVGSKDSVTCAAAALQVLEVSNDVLGGGLGKFAGFLNEIRATQSEALDALHMQADQLAAWVIAELWQPTHSSYPTDGQLGDTAQMRFRQYWKKAVRTSVLSGKCDSTPESPGTVLCGSQEVHCSKRVAFMEEFRKHKSVSAIALDVVSPSSLYRWRDGKSQLKPETIEKLAKALKVKPEQIPN